jgi:hypothetical protein
MLSDAVMLNFTPLASRSRKILRTRKIEQLGRGSNRTYDKRHRARPGGVSAAGRFSGGRRLRLVAVLRPASLSRFA